VNRKLSAANKVCNHDGEKETLGGKGWISTSKFLRGGWGKKGQQKERQQSKKKKFQIVDLQKGDKTKKVTEEKRNTSPFAAMKEQGDRKRE